MTTESTINTTNRPDTKSNFNRNPTTKQHAIVNIHLNIVTCSTYPDKFTLLHHFYNFQYFFSFSVECNLAQFGNTSPSSANSIVWAQREQ